MGRQVGLAVVRGQSSSPSDARPPGTGARSPSSWILVLTTCLALFPWASTSAETVDFDPLEPAHSATLLLDGRVLIAGGVDAMSGEPLASAELYDPATGTFSATGPMSHGRTGHTATLLADGRVLVAGGSDAELMPMASAEVYDPRAGTFAETGAMGRERADHTATLLDDGRVLLAGGAGRSAELYDPVTGTFTQTRPMRRRRSMSTATLLSDGQVLLIGGWGGRRRLATAELFDPDTGRFSAAGAMARPRLGHTATLLADGRVLVAGGPRASADLFDPVSGRFTLVRLDARRDGHTATRLPDGRVLLAGGHHVGDCFEACNLDSAEIFDPATGSSSGTGTMTRGRWLHSATLLLDGRVLIVGGFGAQDYVEATDRDIATAELYDPVMGTFSTTSAPIESRDLVGGS